MTETQQRQAVVNEALTWVSVPYHAHGRIRAGVDCIGLLICVFEACGLVEHVETGAYATDWHLHHSEELFSGGLARYLKAADGPALPGDIFLYRWGRTFSHGAIYVGDNLLVHAYVRRGVILSRFDEDPLGGRERQHWSLWG